MKHLVISTFLFASLTLGCGSQVCTDDAKIGLHLVFDGGGAGDSVSAVAVSGDFSEELHCVLSDATYECSGLTERPGSYAVTATLNGAIETYSVTLEDDGCHVVPQTLTVFIGH